MKAEIKPQKLKMALCVIAAMFMIAASTALTAMAVEIPSEVTLFKNVNIFDGKSDKLLMDYDVLVVDKLIKKVAKGIKIGNTYEMDVKTGGFKEIKTPVPSGGEMFETGIVTVYEPVKNVKKEVKVTVIDGKGRTLMPGLIEGHGHIMLHSGAQDMLVMTEAESGIRGALRAKIYLMKGFTTVRDLGGYIFPVQQLIDRNVIEGPRLYGAGSFIGQTGGQGDVRSAVEGSTFFQGAEPTWMIKTKVFIIADGENQVRMAARENLFRGAAFLKLYTGGGVKGGFSVPFEAAQYTEPEVRAAVEEARRSGTFVSTHGYTDEAVNVALDAGCLVFEHANLMTEKTMKRLAKEGAYFSPQIYLFSLDADTNPALTMDVQRKKMKIAQVGVKNTIRWAKKYGVKTLWGTDVNGPDKAFEDFLQEFIARGEYYTPVEQLTQATSVNGGLLAKTGYKNPYKEGPLGVIEEGAYADILLINGNPLEDISILTKPEENLALIMKDGKIYKNTVK